MPNKSLFIFSGNCTGLTEQLFPMSDEEIIERTWHLTSRISTIDCHTKILQVFCAIQYQPNGFCSPPNFVDQLYPERGLRPKFLWEKLTTWQTLPHKVCKSYFIFRENYSTYCLLDTRTILSIDIF